MISEDVAAKGYALMCMAQPKEDCKIMTISEVCVVCVSFASFNHLTACSTVGLAAVLHQPVLG